MPYRKTKLVKGEIYHIYSKSIADFKIFNSVHDYERMQDELLFYSTEKPGYSFAFFRKLKANLTLKDAPTLTCLITKSLPTSILLVKYPFSLCVLSVDIKTAPV